MRRFFMGYVSISVGYVLIPILALLSSCSYSINMIHSEGVASDMVDETQAPTADVSPTLSVPAKAL